MNLAEEYGRQSTWRDWQQYLKHLPVSKQDVILDLGCSIGTVSKLLSAKGNLIIGIDNNNELLQEAEKTNQAGNIRYILGDLKSPKQKDIPQANGIWSSFTAAYFPDLIPILEKWLQLLQPNGWLALVEMDDLFGHEPLTPLVRDIFNVYYERQCQNNLYDFKMGGKIKDYLIRLGLKIIHEENMNDQELTFSGAATPYILKAWENRFDRMYLFKEYLGNDIFAMVKNEFLKCISSENHVSNTLVKFLIARII